MNPQAYSYPPLDKSRNEIRLLRLSPSDTPRTSFQCHLEVFDLDNAPTFTSLSYAWGGTTRDVPLHTSGGSIIMIGKNLHDFLRHLVQDAFNEGRPWLWIDQISIDQSSVAEKNHQVNLMSRIYRECERVIAWLGCDEAVVKAAQACIDCPTYGSLWAIWANHYFSRLWIVQEFLLARELRIMCGPLWLNEDFIFEIGSCHLSCRGKFGSDLSSDRRSSTRPFSLCLEQYSDRDCSDPRDKVYGLLGLEDHPTNLVPDYEKSTVEVFKDAVVMMRDSPSCVGTSANDIYKIAVQLAYNMGVSLDSEELLGSLSLWVEAIFHSREYYQALEKPHPPSSSLVQERDASHDESCD